MQKVCMYNLPHKTCSMYLDVVWRMLCMWHFLRGSNSFFFFLRYIRSNRLILWAVNFTIRARIWKIPSVTCWGQHANYYVTVRVKWIFLLDPMDILLVLFEVPRLGKRLILMTQGLHWDTRTSVLFFYTVKY